MAIGVRTPSSTQSPSHVLPVRCDEPLLGRYEARASSSEKVVVVQNGAQDGREGFVRTCLNGLNALSGVGLLSVPYALSEGGWLSLVLLLVVAAICCYTGLLLERCMAVDPGIRSYPDIGELAFGCRGRLLVSAFMYLELYFVAIGFLILDGDNLDKLFPGASVSVGPLTVAGKRLFVILVALVVAPTTWLRSLGLLAYVSATGVFASVIIVFCVLWTATVDGVGFSGRGTPLKFTGLPTVLGLYTFCYCGHAVFPTLYTSMKDKSQFSKMLVLCFVLCTLNYGSMAVLGYLMYGDDVQSQVTLNLPGAQLSTKIAIYTTLITPFSKYALVITPIATSIEERMQVGDRCAAAAAVMTRAFLVLSTVLVALAVPFFGYLMALVGSLLSISACMMLPCICYLKVFKASRHRTAEIATIAGILVLASLVAVAGTYSSLMQIIHELY